MRHEGSSKSGSINKEIFGESPLRKSCTPLKWSRLPACGIESLEAQFAQLHFSAADTNVETATPARRRGPSLNRRTGQTGTVVQHSKTWDPTAPAYGRFWADVPGSLERKRRTIPLGVCRTKSAARQRLREYLEREGVNSKQAFHQNTAPANTFRQQTGWWIASLSARKRRPVKPATISGWQDALNAWVLPNIGDRLLSEVSNGAVRELVEKMSIAGSQQKPSSIMCRW
jgi:hypothetical protein